MCSAARLGREVETRFPGGEDISGNLDAPALRGSAEMCCGIQMSIPAKYNTISVDKRQMRFL